MHPYKDNCPKASDPDPYIQMAAALIGVRIVETKRDQTDWLSNSRFTTLLVHKTTLLWKLN